ncbi:ArdC family protein [Bernardetia sp.]|uniref:ArdC family protein n=1 Tax=Bernardetia sp. TaxID=1937974 RepID=UPI0025BF99DA|nr:zincin-like metallopeptidase domain-containing protein [Bernardetia sp.]
MSKQNIYDAVNERIIAKIKEGVAPWRKTWAGGLLPHNYDGRQYHGVNVLLLSMTEFENPIFMTYKQAQEAGGQVKKGSKGTKVVYFNVLQKEDKNGDIDKIPFMKQYTVFNIAQIEGLELPDFASHHSIMNDNERISLCEGVVQNMQNAPKIEENKGNNCLYNALNDIVKMPLIEEFESSEEYYCNLFHELAHSTGHKDRLDRKEVSALGRTKTDYAKEELVAEITAAFLCATTGIENKTIDNSASYLASWLKVLKDNHKFFFQSAAKAQKAADYILNQTK